MGKILTAVCEGCGATEDEVTTDKRRVNAMPDAWVGCGLSKHLNARGKQRSAIWCPTCQRNGVASMRLGISQSNFDPKAEG